MPGIRPVATCTEAPHTEAVPTRACESESEIISPEWRAPKLTSTPVPGPWPGAAPGAGRRTAPGRRVTVEGRMGRPETSDQCEANILTELSSWASTVKEDPCHAQYLLPAPNQSLSPGFSRATFVDISDY